jgi:hypothetical protein
MGKKYRWMSELKIEENEEFSLSNETMLAHYQKRL